MRSDISFTSPLCSDALGARHRLGFGARRGLVLFLDCRPDLLAVDGQRLWRFDAQAHGVSNDLHDVDCDVVAEHYLLPGTPRDDQHGGIPPWNAMSARPRLMQSVSARP